jgi:peptidoglycan/LPS O-acetylase OafA/YrhL
MPTTKDATDATQSSVHLDAIRGAAALVVLLGHNRDLYFSSLNGDQNDANGVVSGQTLGAGQAPAAKGQITIGNEAVMIFFVLSGYLVGGGVIRALRHNTWSWKNYLTKRLTRLWVVLIPALLLGVALDFAGLHLYPSPTSIYAGPPQQSVVHDVAEHLRLSVIAGNAIFLQGSRVSTAGSNDSLWSLSNEFWYYIAFPAVLLAFRKNQAPWLRGVYLLFFAAIALLVGKNISILFFIWVLGALVSVIPLRVPRSAAKIIGSTLAILIPVVFVVVRRAHLPYLAAQWIVASYFAFVLYLLLHQTQRAGEGIYANIARFFSRISYTLYLVHLPLAIFLCAYINDPWHRWDKTPRNLAIFLGSNVGLVLFSYLFYLAFEANTDRVRQLLFHRSVREKHLPTSAATS